MNLDYRIILNVIVNEYKVLKRKARKNEKVHFTPGTVHQEVEGSEDISIAVIYEGYSWRDPDMAVF